MRNTCKSAKRLMAEILEPCIRYQLYRFFYTSLTEMETETRVVSDKKKNEETSQTPKDLKAIFFLSFFCECHVKDAFECQTCVKHVQCDASSWDALFRCFLLVHISFVPFFTLVQML